MFKVGDKVRFKPFEKEWRTEGPHYTFRMELKAIESPVTTIIESCGNGKYKLANGYYYLEHWILPAKRKVYL